jgi:serine acetyltransferase
MSALSHTSEAAAIPVAGASVVRSTGRMGWNETRARMRADYRRLAAVLQRQQGAAAMVRLHPSYICVFLYRISHYLLRGGHWLGARAVWQLNFMLTGADISPAADIGEGLLILSPAGVALMGAAGRNLTVMPCGGIGGEMGSLEDVGAGPGLPLLQDDVVLEPHGGVLGPVRVGNRVRVRAGVVLTKDAPDDSDIEGPAPRFIGRRDRS